MKKSGINKTRVDQLKMSQAYLLVLMLKVLTTKSVQGAAISGNGNIGTISIGRDNYGGIHTRMIAVQTTNNGYRNYGTTSHNPNGNIGTIIIGGYNYESNDPQVNRGDSSPSATNGGHNYGGMKPQSINGHGTVDAIVVEGDHHGGISTSTMHFQNSRPQSTSHATTQYKVYDNQNYGTINGPVSYPTEGGTQYHEVNSRPQSSSHNKTQYNVYKNQNFGTINGPISYQNQGIIHYGVSNGEAVCTGKWRKIASLGCVLFSEEQVNWDMAKSMCTSHGSDLAILADLMHRKAVSDYIHEIGGVFLEKRWWIGGNDRHEGQWKWSTGLKIIDGWNRQIQPDKNTGNNACLNLSEPERNEGDLFHQTCDVLNRYICIKKL